MGALAEFRAASTMPTPVDSVLQREDSAHIAGCIAHGAELVAEPLTAGEAKAAEPQAALGFLDRRDDDGLGAGAGSSIGGHIATNREMRYGIVGETS